MYIRWVSKAPKTCKEGMQTHKQSRVSKTRKALRYVAFKSLIKDESTYGMKTHRVRRARKVRNWAKLQLLKNIQMQLLARAKFELVIWIFLRHHSMIHAYKLKMSHVITLREGMNSVNHLLIQGFFQLYDSINLP